MIYIKSTLGFCDECTEFNISGEEIDDGTNASLINFSVYTHQARCATYGIIPNGSSVCRICELHYNINNGIINRPTYGKKKQLTKISCYIGEFQRVHYQLMLMNYAYNRMLFCLLVKHEWKIL